MASEILVGTRKGLFTLRRGAAGWAVGDLTLEGIPVTLTLADGRDGTRYAALDHGHFGVKLHRSKGGGPYDECAAPSYPEKPEGFEDKNPFTGLDTPWTTKAIWSLAGGGADRPGVLWCGTIPGGVFRSEDGGDSWALVESLWNHPARTSWFGGGADWPGVHSICVDPRNSDHVALGVSCAGVWRTEDGGETWEQSAHGMRAAYVPPDQAHEPDGQDPHLIVQCPAAPDVWWCQHHNGIFKSTNNGRKWEEIEDVKPSVFGFPVAVHPVDPDTAWLVPAVKDEMRIPAEGKVVVNRTRDGGRTFETLSKGLPQEHAYDIVFRHALDIDATGDVLAMGSTTGAVWVTEDQGDSWTEITSHLPPVYSVEIVDG